MIHLPRPKRGAFYLSFLHSSFLRLSRTSWAAAALLALGLGAAILPVPAHADGRRVERRVPPAYPEMAKKMHIGGVVKLVINIAADGNVISAKAQSGNLMLVPAAEDAAKHWKFAPAGAPSTEVVDIRFETDN